MPDTAPKIRASSEAANYLYAILLVVQNKREGIHIILSSGMNVTRSFMAYFWCLPAQLFMWSLIWRRGDFSDGLSHVEFLITVSVMDIGAWLGFAAAIYFIMMLTSLPKLVAPAIITTNWFNLFATYIFFIPASVSYLLPLGGGIAAIMEFVAYIAIVGLYFRVVRHLLNDNKLFAFALTLTNVVLSIFISSIAFDMFG